MNRLKCREHQIPGGFTFLLVLGPGHEWRPAPFSSFQTVVNGVASVVNANRALAASKGWPTDRAGIEAWVEDYQVSLCEKNGWSAYLTGGAPGVSFPKVPAPSVRRVVTAGIGTLTDWLRSGAEAVAPGVAEHRASICADCPLNDKGDWKRWFTEPTAAIVRRALNLRDEWKLTTTRDADLNVCAACGCPLRLKVHVPTEKILAHIAEGEMAKLDEHCWLRKETT